MNRMLNNFHYLMIAMVTPLIWLSPFFIIIAFFSYVMLFVKELFSFTRNKKELNRDLEKINEAVSKIDGELKVLINANNLRR